MNDSAAHAIILKKPLIKETRIEVEITASEGIREYFQTEVFYCEYSITVSATPEGIAIIPVVANLAPVAWVLNATLIVPVLDERFLQALEDVRRSFQELYPNLSWGGDIRPLAVTRAPRLGPPSGDALFFSGGVDSLTSAVLAQWKTTLLTVWGADVPPDRDDLWAPVVEANAELARMTRSPIVFIKSNLRQFFDAALLNQRFSGQIENWWGGVQHGLGLTGLAAPVCYMKSLVTVLVPSTHTREFSEPWGSHPEIDDKIAWNGTRIVHHGYEYSRQEKLGLLGEYVGRSQMELPIRVCYSQLSGFNCNVCEKCCRTIVGLRLAGLNPERHGFKVSQKAPFEIRKYLEGGVFKLGNDEVFMWEDIQRFARERESTEGDENWTFFYQWLANVDVRRLQALSRARRRRRMFVRSILRGARACVPEMVADALRGRVLAVRAVARRREVRR